MACYFADGYAKHYHRVDSRLGTCFGRDGADSVYLCRIFPAATSYRHFGSVYGLALPLYVISTSGTDMEAQLPLAYGTTLVLIMIILLVNLLANALRKYFEKRVKTN